MRDTAKLLTTALLTLSFTFIGAAASPAGAIASRTGRHARNRVRHTARRRSTRANSHPRRLRPATQLHLRHTREHAAHHHRSSKTEGAETGETTSAQTAAKIAAVLSTHCLNTEATPTAENIPLLRTSVLCLINRERAEHGVPPLLLSGDLESAAENHCTELIADDYFAHIAPDGETPVQRIENTGYVPGPSVGYVLGENLAWGTYGLSTPQEIVAAWIASPGHLANILESRYTETGIGITPSVPESFGGGNPGATYAEEFGVIVH